MTQKIQDQSGKLASFIKYIFLIDGLGALLTAFSLAVVLTTFEEHFGMPRDVLYGLAFVAGLFAVYSFTCHFIKPVNWRPFLKVIAIANSIYCLISLGFLFYLQEQIMPLAWVYFLLEILIVGILVFFEWRIANDLK